MNVPTTLASVFVPLALMLFLSYALTARKSALQSTARSVDTIYTADPAGVNM
jgi:uncharacterized paraquat-inducible protein A